MSPQAIETIAEFEARRKKEEEDILKSRGLPDKPLETKPPLTREAQERPLSTASTAEAPASLETKPALTASESLVSRQERPRRSRKLQTIEEFEDIEQGGAEPARLRDEPMRPTEEEPARRQRREPSSSALGGIGAFDKSEEIERKGYRPSFKNLEGSNFRERAESLQRQQPKKMREREGSGFKQDVGTLRHMASSVMLGATDMIAAMPEYVAIAAKYLEEATGLFERDDAIEDRALYKLGQEMRRAAHEWFPQNEELADSFLYTTLPQGAGSLAAFMAMGVAGKIAKLPAWVIPLVGGASMESANMYLEAMHHGATEDEAFGAWLGGHLAGGLEAVPIGRALARFDKISGGGVKKILANGFVGGVEELVQEVAQTMTENYVAKLTFDEQRELMSGTFEAGGAGGILGFAANIALAAAGMRMRGPGGLPQLDDNMKKKMDPKAVARYEGLVAELQKRIDSGEYTRKELIKGEEDIKKLLMKEAGMTEAEIAAGIPEDLKKQVTKEKLEERAEGLDKAAKEAKARKPEMKDKTEEDHIEVVDGKKKGDDSEVVTEKTLPSDKESVAAIDADIAKGEAEQEAKGEAEQEEAFDVDRIREIGAGSMTEEEAAQEDAVIQAEEEAAAPTEEAAAPVEEVPVEAAPEEVGPEITSHENWEPTQAGNTVGGLEVGENIDNLDSISASLGEDYDEIGIREVPMKAIGDDTSASQAHYSAEGAQRSRDLAEEIKESGRIDPLIIAIDEDGMPYILEGQHRYGALAELGIESFPALVVEGQTPAKKARKALEDADDYERKDALKVLNDAETDLKKAISENPSEELEGLLDVVSQKADGLRTAKEKRDKQRTDETAAQKKLRQEKSAYGRKRFYVIGADGGVYSLYRKAYRKLVEKGAKGKDVSDVGSVAERIKKYDDARVERPESINIEEFVANPSLFAAELESLKNEAKAVGESTESAPEGVDEDRHERAIKYGYEVGTVEYYIATNGGVALEQNEDETYKQTELLMEKSDGKPDFNDPLFAKEGGKSFEEWEKSLVDDGILQDNADLEMILSGRKKGDTDYRGHPSIEKQVTEEVEAETDAEELAAAEEEEDAEIKEIVEAAEEEGVNTSLVERFAEDLAEAEESEDTTHALAILQSLEMELTEEIEVGGHDSMADLREKVREVISEKEDLRLEEIDAAASEVAEDEDVDGMDYYSKKEMTDDPDADVVPSRKDEDPPASPPPKDTKKKAETPPPDEPGKPTSDLDEARAVQVMPEDLKKEQAEEDKMTLPERVRELIGAFRTAVASQYVPLEIAERDLYSTAKEPLPTMDAATVAELNNGSDGKAWKEFLEFRMEVVEKIQHDYLDFNTYMFLKRTESRLKDEPTTKRVGKWHIAKVKRSLKQMTEEKTPEEMALFEEIAEKYQEHTDKMLQSLVRSGSLHQDHYDLIKEHNDFYALFKVAKHFRGWDERLEGGGNITNDYKLLHQITGINEDDVQIVDIVGQTARAIYNTKIQTEKQLLKLYFWDMANMDKDRKYFVRGRPDQFYIKQFKPSADILEQYRLMRMANNRQTMEQQLIKVEYGIQIAEELGLKVDKRRLREALGAADVGGVENVKGKRRVLINAFISEVLAHEIGHSFDVVLRDDDGNIVTKSRKVKGVEQILEQRLSSIINENPKFVEEMKKVTKLVRQGGDENYRSKARERWANFINVYIHTPAIAKKLAPSFTKHFEEKIIPNQPKMADTIKRLSDFYVKIDKLPNIMTKLEGLGGDSYFESAVRRAFPDQQKLLVLSKGTDVPEGFKRILLRVEGKQRALDVRADIYEALEDKVAYQGAVMMNFMGKAGAILRGGATIWNATFMVKNAFFRDPVRLALLSKYGINMKQPNLHEILRFPLDWVEAITSAMRGNFGTPDKLYMQWLESGAGFTDIQSRIVSDNLFESKSRGTNLVNTIPRLASALEQSTKLLGFKRALRMEKFDQLPPDMQQSKMKEIAAEIRRYAGSPDFWRHGKKIKGQTSLMFMFLNARIQGVSADLARLGGRRGYAAEAWTNLAVGVGLPTLAAALYNYKPEEREYYEKQNEVERHNYFMVPKGTFYLDDNGDKRQEYWTIPKDDTAKIFSAMVEDFVKFAYDRDPMVIAEFTENFFEDISPMTISGKNWKERGESMASSLNPVLKTPYEWLSGRNSYYHTDIIPRRMENYDPQDQKRSTTPDIFVKIGQVTGQSPLMIEHLTRNITASSLTQFAPLLDAAAGKLKVQEGRGIETVLPVIKMFASSSYGGTEERLDRLVDMREIEGGELGKKFWEVEARYDEMRELKPSEFSREIRELAKTDRDIAKRVLERKKKEAIGWNFMDGMMQSLGVGSGARARYIYGETKLMEAAEKKIYLAELRKKRLLTGTVFMQVKRLEDTRGQDWKATRR